MANKRIVIEVKDGCVLDVFSHTTGTNDTVHTMEVFVVDRDRKSEEDRVEEIAVTPLFQHPELMQLVEDYLEAR